jgi:4-hydroxybenzoate polyprenyltransferase
MARLLLKDFRDIKGDKQEGRMTFLIRYGTRKTCIASGVCWLIAMLTVGVATSFELGVIAPLAAATLSVLLMLRDLSATRVMDEQQYVITFIAKAANYAVITILIFLLCQKHAGLSAAELQLIPAMGGLVLLGSNWLNYVNQSVTRRTRTP